MYSVTIFKWGNDIMAECSTQVIPFYTYYVVRSFSGSDIAEYFGGPFNSVLQAHTWSLDHMILNQGATYNVVEVIHHGGVVK